MKAMSKYVILISLILWILISFLLIFVFNKHTVIEITKEDEVVENLTAIFFFVTSLMFLYLFLTDTSGNNFYLVNSKKNLFYLFLFILFIFGSGEEISWGQRIFNISTPQSWEKINHQGELNIHNLYILEITKNEYKTGLAKLLTLQGLFHVFWFTFCFIIPLLNKINLRISKIIKYTNIPIVPLEIGVLFLLNYIIAISIKATVSNDIHHSIVEIEEMNFAFLFLMVSIVFMINFQTKKHYII